MTKSFKEALKARRTFYQIENKSTLSDKEIRDLIRFAVEFVPSAFNSQTTRVALLTGKAHEKLWNLSLIHILTGRQHPFFTQIGCSLYFSNMASGTGSSGMLLMEDAFLRCSNLTLPFLIHQLSLIHI